MNRKILGKEDNVAQWKLPVEKGKGERHQIGMINIENYHGQIIMSSFEKLIDQCIADEVKKRNWRYATSHYNGAMKTLQKRGGNCTEQEKHQFQFLVDRVYLTLQSMYGKDSFHLVTYCGS